MHLKGYNVKQLLCNIYNISFWGVFVEKINLSCYTYSAQKNQLCLSIREHTFHHTTKRRKEIFCFQLYIIFCVFDKSVLAGFNCYTLNLTAP